MRLWRQGASCCRNGLMYQPFQPAAAGNAHAQHGNACNAAVFDDAGQFFDQHFVVFKLGAGNNGHPATHPVAVQIGQGKARAVCGQQDVCAL